METTVNDIEISVQRFKSQLIETINAAGAQLPPSLLNYVVKEIQQDVENSYKMYLQQLQMKTQQTQLSATESQIKKETEVETQIENQDASD